MELVIVACQWIGAAIVGYLLGRSPMGDVRHGLFAVKRVGSNPDAPMGPKPSPPPNPPAIQPREGKTRTQVKQFRADIPRPPPPPPGRSVRGR